LDAAARAAEPLSRKKSSGGERRRKFVEQADGLAPGTEKHRACDIVAEIGGLAVRRLDFAKQDENR
jgi:hypothetical protein